MYSLLQYYGFKRITDSSMFVSRPGLDKSWKKTELLWLLLFAYRRYDNDSGTLSKEETSALTRAVAENSTYRLATL